MPLQRHVIVDIIYAAKEGMVDEVERLLLLSDPKYDHLQALLQANENGHHEVVRRLVTISNVSDPSYNPLSVAVKKGFVECVRVLAPFAHTKDREHALCVAAIKHDQAIADLLYDWCDVHSVLDQLKRKLGAQQFGTDLQQRVDAQNEKKILSDAVNSSSVSSGKKKI